jgi:hypothetical protein
MTDDLIKKLIWIIVFALILAGMYLALKKLGVI